MCCSLRVRKGIGIRRMALALVVGRLCITKWVGLMVWKWVCKGGTACGGTVCGVELCHYHET